MFFIIFLLVEVQLIADYSQPMFLKVVVLAFEITVTLRRYQVFIPLRNVSKPFNHVELVVFHRTSLINELDGQLTNASSWLPRLHAPRRHGTRSTFCASVSFIQRVVRLSRRVAQVRLMLALGESCDVRPVLPRLSSRDYGKIVGSFLSWACVLLRFV